MVSPVLPRRSQMRRIRRTHSGSFLLSSSGRYVLTIGSVLLLTAVWAVNCFYNGTLLGEDEIMRNLSNKSSYYYGFFSMVQEGDSSIRRRGRRRPVARDEFFYAGRSASEIDAFFGDSTFDSSQFLQSVGPIDPLWTCSSRNTTSRPTKLIYVHMARSGGATMRALLRGYAEFCHAGLQLMEDCVDLSLENMRGDFLWRNNMMANMPDAPCQVRYTANRSGYKTQGGGMNSARLVDYDILGGTLPLGADAFWTKDSNQANQTTAPRVPVQYLTLFREPLEKLVSHVVLAKTNGTAATMMVGNFSLSSNTANVDIDTGVDNRLAWVIDHMEQELRNGNFSDLYSHYLMTPTQKHWIIQEESILWTPKQRISLSLKNLLQLNVVVGLVDASNSTLHLVRYLLDQSLELSTMFDFFHSSTLTSRVPQLQMSMAARDGNQEVVRRIQSNRTLQALAGQYLQYDRILYRAAIQIHQRQYEWLQQQSDWWDRWQQQAKQQEQQQS